MIAVRRVQPGQVVTAGNELLRLIRRGRLEWRAEIAERDIGRLKIGANVVLRSPDGENVAGVVRAVSPGVDPQTRTGALFADLPAPGTLRSGMFVEFDSQARTVGDDQSRSHALVLHWKQAFVVEARLFRRGLTDLKGREVWHGGRKVRGCGGADGAERVVWHEVDVVRFGPPCDLHRFRESSNVADVDPCVVGDAPLNVREELPLGAELLTDCERDVCHPAQGLIGLGCLVPDRFLQKVEGVTAQFLAERRCFGN
ncbi:MAG: HlyD family efflux transporter periplasmic adaptor subunit [Proteobacteria bacterium]|nr:HlyD family efflux transporter periplasmic adaptor subunit [Pseudomonadota bacterium]